MRKQTLLVLSELFAIVANKNQSVDNQVYIAEFENFLASLVETEYIKGFVDYFANNLSECATVYNLKKLISLKTKSQNIFLLSTEILNEQKPNNRERKSNLDFLYHPPTIRKHCP